VAAVTVVAAVGALAAVEKGGDVEPQNLSVQPVNRAKGSTIRQVDLGFVIWHQFDFTYSILDYCFRVYFGTAT
jgi:hypothetical protein